MKTKFNEAAKQSLVHRYQQGTSVADLRYDTGIPQSTIYSWIKQHNVTKTEAGTIVTPRSFDTMKRRLSKLEGIVKVLKSVDCTVFSPSKIKLDALEALYGQFSVHVLCEALDVPRGTFYNHIKRGKRDNAWFIKRRESLKELIRGVHEEYDHLFGAGKIRATLVSRGHRVSEHLVSELMKEMDIYSIRSSTKRNYSRFVKIEKKTNILKRNFRADAPDMVWVSDVSYYKINGKFYFICTIIDLYSRKVIAHKISFRNSTRLVTSTFKEAYASRKPSKKLLFHSDRGVQYTSYAFRKLLQENDVRQSFSNPGTPNDNAVAEAFFSSLKQEDIYTKRYRSDSDFRRGIDKYITFYNTVRPHAGINYKTPEQMEQILSDKEK